jgi:fructose-bisphosphate aldolase class II
MRTLGVLLACVALEGHAVKAVERIRADAKETESAELKALTAALLAVNSGASVRPGTSFASAARLANHRAVSQLPKLKEAATPVLPAQGRAGSPDMAVAEKVFPKLPESVKPGVVTGSALKDLLDHAKKNKFAIPGVNIVSSSSINACMEAAGKYGGPIIVTFSVGGAQFIAGKSADNTNYKASIAGAIAGAKHVRELAKLYGVPVILHTDHCHKAVIPWLDGLVEANEEYFKENGEPLFSSHMLDLSEEPLEENVAICKTYLERMAKMNVMLEMELGITGGEEDGVDNTDVDASRLYTQPDEVWYTYKELSEVPNAMFSVAASFGNVHGVYSPGNVELRPQILHDSQAFIKEKLGSDVDKPVYFVFHGGSGSSQEDIAYAIEAGVIKMNMDTDTQWAFWDGMRNYESKFHDYLQGQIGSPDGDDKPNKKYYDPRAVLRAAEMSMTDRLVQAAKDLNCVDVL